MHRALYTLTSRRFPEGVTCRIIHQVPGTACFLVDVGDRGRVSAYATESELSSYDGRDHQGR